MKKQKNEKEKLSAFAPIKIHQIDAEIIIYYFIISSLLTKTLWKYFSDVPQNKRLKRTAFLDEELEKH